MGDGGNNAEQQPMSETAWLSITEEGTVHITYLDPDGRYRDQSGGETVFAGSWEQSASDDLCFAPDEGEGACWKHGSADSDGVMRATNREGRSIELTRVTYNPPPAVDSAEEESGGD